MGFPGGSDSKESACNAGDLGLIPGLGKFPGGGHGNPLWYSCLENPHGQRSLAGCTPCGRKVTWATKHTANEYSPKVHSFQFSSSVEWALWPHGLQPARLPHPIILSLNKSVEVKWKSLSCVRLFETTWTIQSMEFSRTQFLCASQPQPSVKRLLCLKIQRKTVP